MADVNSNININFNTAAALAQLRQLQAGLSKFHQTLAEGNLAAANAQKGLNAQLLQSVGATGKFSASQVKVAGSTLAFTSALEKNKLSLREYYRYTMAAATANTRVMGKAFAQEREIINRARRDRVKALQSQYIQMNKANAGFMDAIRIMPKSLQMASGKFTELGTRIQYAAQRQQFLNQLLKQGSTQLLNFGKNTQWAGRQLMVGLTMPLALFGAAAAKAFKELDAEIVKFRRVYGDAFTNDAEVNAAVENIRKLGNEYTKYGVSVTKTMEMAATAAAAGFQGDALTAQVETATKLSVLGQIEQQQALETTISLQSAFGISSEDLAKKIDFLNAVENQTLLSIEDLTIAIPKAAPVVKQLGGTVEDLAFFLTAMKEGGINASEGANALKSGLASLINPSKKSAAFLADLGINIRGIVEGNSGDIKATVVGFAQALDTLDPLNRARAIEQLFGKFQFSRLSTLFQNVTKEGSQASRAFDLAGSSIEELAVLSEREMKKIEDSTGVKFQAAIEKFKQEIMPLGKAFLEALTPIVKFFGGLFEKFNGLSDQTKKVVATIIGVVAGLGPIVLMTFGLLANGVANVIKFFAMLRGGIAKLNGQTSVMGAGFNYMTQEQIESATASQQLHQTHTRLIEVFNVERASVSALAGSYSSLSTQMRAMASQNPALFAGGLGGAKAAVSKLPPVRKYKEGILSVPGPKGAGDVVPAMLSPGEAVIPTETTDKYRGLITAMFQDKVPGFMAGRLPGGPGRGIPLSAGPAAVRDAQQAKYRRRDDARQGYSEPHPEKKSGPTFIGMPKSASEASQSRQILDKISNSVKAGRFADVPPTNFGTMLQSFSGRSFPARGVGGVYRKPNGQIVVVKPTMDETTALAEVRATQIAREVHGLVSPKQTIKTMMDPTDPTGQRKFIVIESPYDPRIAAMSGKFSKSEMIKQLVASTLRGDKDLQKPNLSGNVLADVGTAGVFDRASGFRDFAKVMPSMEQQAIVNLLGVKGGAKKFFAQETSGLAASMTPAQYDAAIKGEINRSIPRLENVIKSFNLDPVEQVQYAKMLDRLKAGAKTDWAALHPMHARAGEGAVKAMSGLLDPGALSPEMKEQVGRYVSGPITQQQAMIDKLRFDAQNAFALKLAELDSTDPTRASVVRAAWEGGKALMPPSMEEKGFSSPRQSSFLNEISKMTPVHVDGVTKYVHDIDMEKFVSDPNGRVKYARTQEEVINKLLYRMGAIKKNGKFVATNTFKGKFASPTDFLTDLRSGGKESGSWKSNVKKEFRKPLGAAESAYNKGVANDPRFIKMMTDAGLTPAQARAELKAELSHKAKTGAPGRGSEKWLRGTGSFDSLIVNRYMNGTARLKNLLEWNKNNGYSLIPKDGIDKYYQAASFMSRGGHPTNAREASLVALAADADLRAISDSRVPSSMKTDYTREKLNAMRALLGDKAKRGFYESATRYNFGAGNSKGLVLAQLGEYLYDKRKQTLEKITEKNTKKAASNVKADTGNKKDNRVVQESSDKSVVTKSQAARIARGRGVTVLPGREKGTPEISKAAQGRVTNAMQKQAQLLKQRNNLTQKEINQALTQYRTRLIAAEVEKRNNHEKQKAAADEKRQRAQSSQTARQVARQAKADAKAAVKEKRMARQQKIGGISGGASMALGTAGMGLMMAGNQTAGMAAMGASAVAGLAPMFAGMGPAGLIATGVVAVGASLWALDKHFKEAAKKQVAFVNSISATAEKMDKVGEVTGKVGAARAMGEFRSKGSFGDYNDVSRAGTQFGDTFLESEVGKEMTKGFVENMARYGSKQAAQDFGLQLATYISDGVLTSDQAASIAEQIGVELGSRQYTTNIQAEVRNLVGPNGEDLAKDALTVRTNLIQEVNNRSVAELDALKQGGGRDNAARIAGLSLNNIEIVKAQNDATEWQYRKQIQIFEKQLSQTTVLEKQLELKTKISELESKMEADTKVTTDLLKKQINSEMDAFKNNIQKDRSPLVAWLLPGDDEEDAYLDGLKASIQEKFKDTFPGLTTQIQKDVAMGGYKAQELVSRGFTSEGASSVVAQAQNFEVFANLMMGQGFTDPQQFTEFMKLYAGNEGTLYKDLQVAVDAQGPEKAFEMLQFFTDFKNKDLAQKIYADIITKDPKQFDKIGKALAQLSVLDSKEINVEAFLGLKDASGKPIGLELLEKLSNDLAKIEDMPDVTTKEAILKYFEQGAGKGMAGMDKAGLETLMAKWKNWDKLPDVAKKEAISKYKTIYETVFADPIARKEYAEKAAREAANERSQGGRISYLYDVTYRTTYESLMKGDANQQATAIASAGAYEYVGESGVIDPKVPAVDPNSSSTGTKVDPYANLLKRLKEVRNAAIDASGGIKALNKALAEGNVTSVKNKYKGTEQQLQGKGYNQGFIDFIQGMDPKEQKKWMRTAYKETKGKNKGKIMNPFSKKVAAKGTKAGQVFLSQDAKSMGSGFDALVSGEFNTQADRQLKSLKYQEDAYQKLRALGYDHLTSQKIISDEYLAQSISTGKITTEEIAKNGVLAKEIVTREKINGLIQSGRDKINEQSMYIAKSKDEISKVQELLKFLGDKNIKFGEGAVKDIIGDPETLAALIAGMENVKNETDGATKAMEELVAGVKALKDNSDIELAIKIVTQTTTETLSQGAQAAQRINDALLGVYKNLNASQLGKITSKNPKTGVTKNTGAQAIENVGKRYSTIVDGKETAAGATIPKIDQIDPKTGKVDTKGFDSADTVRSVQKERAELGKTISIAQANANAAQQAYSNIMDSIRSADEKLRTNIDAITEKYKTQVDGLDAQNKKIDDAQEKIDDAQEVIDGFTEQEDELNKNNAMYSNDLALIDNLSDDINKKYDKQVEALETVNELNEQIAQSQQQQLDLADALSQGDIAAAARAAQEMRATSAANQGDAMMQGLEKSRQNELGSLVGPESGMTRLQIEKEQFRISQELYKLEIDPKRVEANKVIKDNTIIIKNAKKEIERLEKLMAEEIKKAEASHKAIVESLKAAAADAKKIADDAAATVTSLQAEDTALASIEDYLTAIAEEAAALDESTGYTLEDYLEMLEKMPDLVKLAKDYKEAMVAAEVASGKMSTSWTEILKSITDLPETINIKSVLDIIENITRNITEYITTVNVKSGASSSSSSSSSSSTSTDGAPGKAWLKDGNGVWIKPTKPFGDYEWNDDEGWVKETKIDPNDGDTILKNAAKALAEKAEADAKAKAEAEAKAAADAATNALLNDNTWWSGTGVFRAKGGLINPMKFAMGGFAKGTDTVPAMLTPGEFIMSKYAVQAHGIDNMKAINSGKTTGGAVYNNTYALTVNAKTDANPNEIAQAVMSTIKQVDDRRIRGVSLNGR